MLEPSGRSCARVLVTGALAGFSWAATADAAPYCREDGGPVAPGAETGPLLRHLEDRLGPMPVASIGPAAETLADELREQLCADVSVAATLPNTCAPGAGGTLLALRARLVLDLLNLPAAASFSTVASMPGEQRVAVAFLAALPKGLEPAEVAHRVAFALGSAKSEECLPPDVPAGDPVALAVRIVWQLAQDPAQAGTRTQEQSVALIVSTLEQARGMTPVPALDEAQTERIREVAKQSQATFAWWNAWRTNPADSGALSQLVLSEFRLFQAAMSLTHVRSVSLPGEALAMIDALLQGDLEASLSVLRQWLQSRDQLGGEVAAAETVLRFLRARDRAEAERIVRGQVLGLGPWSEKILFAASGGIPAVESDNLNVVGEGLLGYNDNVWGAVAAGGVSIFDFEDSTVQTTTVKFFANGDGWLSLGLGERSKIDLRGTFDYSVFDTDTTQLDGFFTGSETSVLIRGGGLLGLRYQAERLGIGGWLGGGFQVDSHDQTAIVSADDAAASENESIGGIALARLRMQWGFVPDVLALRVSLDGKWYGLTRLARRIDTANPDEVFAETDTGAQQFEAIGRSFIDVEAARFFEFVPGLGVGLDHYQLAVSGQATQVSTTPIYLFGIRRTAF